MERVLSKLQEFIIKHIQPNHLMEQEVLPASLEHWHSLWSNEREIIRKDFTDHLTVNNDHNVALLTGLITLADLVCVYLTRNGKIWQRSHDAKRIKLFYQGISRDLQTFIELLSGFDPMAFHLAPFLIIELPSAKQTLKFKYQQLEKHLTNFNIDHPLSTMLIKTIKGYIRRPSLTRREHEYLTQLMIAVLALSITDIPTLKKTLFHYNFNPPEFFTYWIHEWDQLLDEEPGLYEQMELLIMEQDRLSNLRVRHQAGLLLSDESLNVELGRYLQEKRQMVMDLINLRRARLQENELVKLARRIKINMSVAQLGLFIRLQLEKGILLKDNVGKLFNFYATHFYTPQTDSISPQSLQKKSTEIEYATAQKLKSLLISMINWLNENFN
ncbi:hypothetical protein SNE25_08870 [Mucilaginibacter sabulilitoris]|uniref:Uncharacterized protein n=1 Tax=Mucilaginibacter sabulilitoris TaxID=1173583 RepID=A0ABZ0TV13_9SPHI|nr:hypothetical protein [Mucilaginibacter sabulilitoris]WPU95629.1 hypothetical protein SNE25_08870 [Mucilaginibacter sabulilitoris]